MSTKNNLFQLTMKTWRFHFHKLPLNLGALTPPPDEEKKTCECCGPTILDAFNRFLIDNAWIFRDYMVQIDSFEEVPMDGK